MSRLSCRVPSGVGRLAFPARAALVCGLWALAICGGAGNAQAQTITTQMLIGDAVSPAIRSRSTPILTRQSSISSIATYWPARQFLEAAKKKRIQPCRRSIFCWRKMYFLSGNAAAGRASLEKTATETPDDPEAAILLADQALGQGRI